MRLALKTSTTEGRLPVATVGMLWASIIQLIAIQLEQCLQLHTVEVCCWCACSTPDSTVSLPQTLTSSNHSMLQRVLALAKGLSLGLEGPLDDRDPELAGYMERRGFLKQGTRLSYRLPTVSAAPAAESRTATLPSAIPKFLPETEVANTYPYGTRDLKGSRLQRFSQLAHSSAATESAIHRPAAFVSSDRQLPRQQPITADAAFNVADLNGDGVVDRKEFHQVWGDLQSRYT